MEYRLIFWISFINFILVLQESGTQEVDQYEKILNRSIRNHESDAINHGTIKSSKKANHDNIVRDIDNSEYKLTKEHYSSLKPKSESLRDNEQGNNPKGLVNKLGTSARKLMPLNLKYDNLIFLDPRNLQNLDNINGKKSQILKSHKVQPTNLETSSNSERENKSDTDNQGKIRNQKHKFYEIVDEYDDDESDIKPEIIKPVELKKNKVKNYYQKVKSQLSSTKNETKGNEDKLMESERKTSPDEIINLNFIKVKPNPKTLKPKKPEYSSKSEVKKIVSEPKELPKDKNEHNNSTTHINIESNPSVELELDTLPKITIDRETLATKKALPTKVTENDFEHKDQQSTQKKTIKVVITPFDSDKISNDNSLNGIEINADSTFSDQKQGVNEHIVIKNQKWAGPSERSPTNIKDEVKHTVPYLAETRNTRPYSIYVPSPDTSYTLNNNLYYNNPYKQNCGTNYEYPSENTSTLNKIGLTIPGHLVFDPECDSGEVNERNSDGFKDRTWRYFKMTQIDMNKGIATNINTVDVTCPNSMKVEVPKQTTLYRRPEYISGTGCYGNGNKAYLGNCCYYPSYTNSL